MELLMVNDYLVRQKTTGYEGIWLSKGEDRYSEKMTVMFISKDIAGDVLINSVYDFDNDYSVIKRLTDKESLELRQEAEWNFYRSIEQDVDWNDGKEESDDVLENVVSDKEQEELDKELADAFEDGATVGEVLVNSLREILIATDTDDVLRFDEKFLLLTKELNKLRDEMIKNIKEEV